MIIKSILFIVSLLFITYRMGLLIAHYTEKEEIVEIFLFGLMSFFAILQMVLLPFVLIHTAFMIPYILAIIILISIIIISFFVVKSEEEKKIWKNLLDNIRISNKTEIIIGIVAIILVIGQAIVSSYLFRENADDSFYVSLAEQSIDSKSLYMEDPSLGLEKDYSLFSSFEQISTYELGIAMIAKTFDIKPVILFHSVLPFVFIIFAYLAYYYLASKFLDKKNSKIFLAFLTITFLFAGFSSKFRTGCLLYKAWQGKAVFLNIGLTTFYGIMIEKMKKKDKGLLFLIAMTNIACVFLSSSSIFIIPFAYIGFGVLNLIKKDWKEILELIISFIPIVIYVFVLIILMKTTKLNTQIAFTKQNIKDLLLLYGNIKYLILYFISFIVISILGDKEEKKFFILIPIINMCTIWNPLFINFIAKYLTSSVTFWRVLWLLPVEITISYAITLVLDKIPKIKYKIIFTVFSVIIIVFCGKFAYTKQNAFYWPENMEKIPQYIIKQTNYILDNSKQEEKIMVMAPGEPLHSCTMRQLSSKIELLYSRIMYFDDLLSNEEIIERHELYKIYEIGVPDYTQEEFNKKIEKFNINWIIIPKNKELEEYLKETNMEKATEIDGYDIYKKM